MTSLIRTNVPTVAAEANWGRWVVPCYVCSDALKVTPGDSLFHCWGCGAEAEILWPANREAIERLLLLRPLAQTRNWFPGETLHDLLEENVTHGIGPKEPGQMISIVGDHITHDSLPAYSGRLQIGA